MTGNTAMRGEKIYDMELDLTGVTDYGVSMDGTGSFLAENSNSVKNDDLPRSTASFFTSMSE